MNVWLLSILVTLTWVLWAVGGAIALHADKRQGKSPQDAGFSFVPIIPLFPILAVVAAVYADKIIAPWGTRVVGGLHVVLAVTFLVAIAGALHRMRSGRDS
jgi:hypothetical protein